MGRACVSGMVVLSAPFGCRAFRLRPAPAFRALLRNQGVAPFRERRWMSRRVVREAVLSDRAFFAFAARGARMLKVFVAWQ